MATPVRSRRLDAAQVASLGLVIVGVVMLADQAGVDVGRFAVPAVLVGMGAVAISRDVAERGTVHRSRWVGSAAGAMGVLIGLPWAMATAGALPTLRQGAIVVSVAALGLGLLFGPWWVRLGRELAAERRERIRTAERVEVATHVHDSVLQTLALIQKASDDPAKVARLARRQERALRSWLYGGAAAPIGGSSPPASLADALRQAVEAVEDDFAVRVDSVVVGDRPIDAPGQALIDAGAEAMRNAASHARVASIDVYLEASPRRAVLFVRDRGAGFDPAAVSADRHGIAESIVGRLARVGGRATIRSAPGEGTEVELELVSS